LDGSKEHVLHGDVDAAVAWGHFYVCLAN